ncbi:MAG TPA: WecB/TagA/CpsF family glycosyltransferase [Anaerolineales bacterium]
MSTDIPFPMVHSPAVVANLESVNILGVQVASLDRNAMMDLVLGWADRGGGDEGKCPARTILYVNAHCLNIASVDQNYRSLLNQADLVYPDGISVVWAGKLLHGCQMYKITGADWIYNFCEAAVRRCLRVYILAGKPGIAALAGANLERIYPGLQIVGARDGYFAEKSESEVLQELAQTSPDVVFVGMGVPRQEKWIADHRAEIATPVCWAVGALFDYVAGKEPRVPVWLNALALEWLWRLLIDPTGKWKRYLFGNPLFIFRILLQKLGW